MRYLLDADDDWIETFRRYWYPRLDPILRRLGGYATGGTGPRQYVGTYREAEDVIEKELVAAGGLRNPIACLKQHEGRTSEGSWRFTHDSDPTGQVAAGMQLHLTLFERDDGRRGRELFAHYEDDWQASPRDHLRGANFDVDRGVQIAGDLISEHTFLVSE